MNKQGPPVIDYGPYNTARDASQHFQTHFLGLRPNIKFPWEPGAHIEDMEAVFRSWWPANKAKWPAEITADAVWDEIQKQMSAWPFSIK